MGKTNISQNKEMDLLLVFIIDITESSNAPTRSIYEYVAIQQLTQLREIANNNERHKHQEAAPYTPEM
jgi:hypothetical protein